MTVQMSLLEWLSFQANCSHVSELKFLGPAGLNRLLRRLEGLPPEAASLEEWNEVLEYLLGEPPCHNRLTAKRQVIMLLKKNWM